MHHDKCYDAAVDKKVCFDVAWEYIDSYKWKCINSTAICTGRSSSAAALRHWPSRSVTETSDNCKAALCACDVAVVNCWSQYGKPQRRAKCNRTRPTPKTDRFLH